MTTPIDIIDTAIKIGLGATISGLTTYLVTKRNHSYEKRKDSLFFTREKLVEISDKIQKTSELSNELKNSFNINHSENLNFEEKDLAFELETSKQICHITSAAYTSCSLIGDSELATLIEEYWNEFNDLYLSILRKEFAEADEYRLLISKAAVTRKKIYNQFSKSLKKIST